MPLSDSDRERARYHLGYLEVAPAPAMVLGQPRMMQTSFLIENSFPVLMENAVPRVVGILDHMDAIETQEKDAIKRLKATKLDTLALRGDETDALEKEYCKWGWRLAGLLGCTPYAFSSRYAGTFGGAQSAAGNIPVEH